MKETRKQRENRIFENTARVGFEHGFVEGAKYAMNLLLGLPKPTAVIVDDSLEKGTTVIHVSPGTELQEARAGELRKMVQVVNDQETILRAARKANPDGTPQ